jgi:hypothetical protein
MTISTTPRRAIALCCLVAAFSLVAVGCAAPSLPPSPVRIAHLGAADGDPPAFEALRAAFEAANPGYRLEHAPRTARLAASTSPRAVFVQAGEARGAISRLSGELSSDLGVGDVVCLRAGWSLRFDAPLQLVVFALPTPFAADIPAFIRPDWDPRITDTVGGCATEEGAYRRILLT